MFRWGITALIFLCFATPVFAVTITFSDLPTSVDRDQEVELSVQLSCSGCSDSFLRGVFYPSGTNYSGFTLNNAGEWVGTSSDKTKYFKVGESEIVESSWSGKLKIKFDPAEELGNYFFKIARYTSGGSSTWSEPTQILVTGPSPTPTPTPAPTNTTAPTHTPNPTTTPKPPTPTHTPKPTPTSTPKPTIYKIQPTSGLVLATTAIISTSKPSPQPTTHDSQPSNNTPAWPGFVLVGLGTALLAVSGFLFLRSKSNQLSN